ncbi:MAG TPA: hypothetical protein VFJ70_17055 [Burkholderiales bacterium]|nr:hypothetical protein [Burkholderiales bacterium]
MGNAFQVRALKTASKLMGRPERLRDMLGAPPGAFCRWYDGYEVMPPAVLAMVLNFLADMESAAR